MPGHAWTIELIRFAKRRFRAKRSFKARESCRRSGLCAASPRSRRTGAGRTANGPCFGSGPLGGTVAGSRPASEERNEECSPKWRTVLRSCAPLSRRIGSGRARGDGLALGRRRRLRIADLRCRGVPSLCGIDGSGKLDDRNGDSKAPVFLLSCFPDPLSRARVLIRVSAILSPAASSATSDRTME